MRVLPNFILHASCGPAMLLNLFCICSGDSQFICRNHSGFAQEGNFGLFSGSGTFWCPLGRAAYVHSNLVTTLCTTFDSGFVILSSHIAACFHHYIVLALQLLRFPILLLLLEFSIFGAGWPLGTPQYNGNVHALHWVLRLSCSPAIVLLERLN